MGIDIDIKINIVLEKPETIRLNKYLVLLILRIVVFQLYYNARITSSHVLLLIFADQSLLKLHPPTLSTFFCCCSDGIRAIS